MSRIPITDDLSYFMELMQRYVLKVVLLLSISLLELTATTSANPLPYFYYEPVDSGYIQCPDALPYPHKNFSNKPFCDASAVSYFPKSNTLIYAADWWGGNYHYPFMTINWDFEDTKKNTSKQLKPSTRSFAIEKVEDMSQSENRQFTMATASFTHTPESYKQNWQNLNRVVYWVGESPKQLRIPNIKHNGETIAAIKPNYDKISEILRSSIKFAIQKRYPDTEYFKIEALAFLPENKIAFGVREIGVSYTAPQYVSLIITTSYSQKEETLTLDTNFEVLFDFRQLAEKHGITETLGLSSLEYDFNKNRLYMTLTYENKENGQSFDQVGAYLWVLTYNQKINTYSIPAPVVNLYDNSILHFRHKVEGVTIDNEGQLILISDDDKVTGVVDSESPGSFQHKYDPYSSYRNHNQARFNVIKVLAH